MSPSHCVCLIELMPRSDNARFMDLVKFNGVVEGSRRSIRRPLVQWLPSLLLICQTPQRIQGEDRKYVIRLPLPHSSMLLKFENRNIIPSDWGAN